MSSTEKKSLTPCVCDSQIAGQSPIALIDGESVYYIKHSLDIGDTTIKDYTYDEEKKIWNIVDHSFIQFHFHERAEHTINHKEYDMELHLVFRDADEQLSVIAILIKESDTTSDQLKLIVENKSFKINKPSSYWNYCGSLTSFPYNTSINWIISDHVLEITSKDLSTLRNVSQSKRELQKRGGRDIVRST